MKPSFSVLLSFPILLSACREHAPTATSSKAKMQISFEVIPEDYALHLYNIVWEDTCGQSEGYEHNKIKRPQEVWCFVTDKHQDTLGYYSGMSTAQTFTGFQTKDSIITVQFMTGFNFFSDRFDEPKEAIDYAFDHHLPIVYQPLQINLKTDLRKKMVLVLQEE
ncbi:MAG: hypothetical protein WC716_12740 [Chitinophagaceae bacterium]|jgi:hypothetical protein